MRPYPVPKIHEEMFKTEVEHLVLLGVLEVVNDSEWVAPSFAHPKSKSNLVRLLINLRNINKQLKGKPYPLKNQWGVIEIRGFSVCYATWFEHGGISYPT